MRKKLFSVNWLTSRFRFFCHFYVTINRNLIWDFRTRDFLTIFCWILINLKSFIYYITLIKTQACHLKLSIIGVVWRCLASFGVIWRHLASKITITLHISFIMNRNRRSKIAIKNSLITSFLILFRVFVNDSKLANFSRFFFHNLITSFRD